MENLVFFLATSFVLRLSSSRNVKTNVIGNTGCSSLFYSRGQSDSCITPDGDRLYCSKFSENKVSYGLICVQFSESYEMNKAVQLLTHYINKLKTSFRVLHDTGIQKDVDWNSEYSTALVDYWQDAEKKDWKVKGYTNGDVMAVLYVKNISEADVKKQDIFLDSFHFGETTVRIPSKK